MWKNKYLKLKYLHTLEHCLHNNTERQGQKKELAQSERQQQNGVEPATDKVCRDLCVEKRKIEGSKQREKEEGGENGRRIEIVCDCAEELKLQSPSCCLRPRQIYYHTRQQKTQTYGGIVCLCVCVCTAEGEVCRSRQKIKRNEASTHTHRGRERERQSTQRRRKLRLLQIKYFTGQLVTETG